jgi:hypothetical protein
MTQVVDNTIVFDKQTYELRKQWWELYGNNYTYDHVKLIATPKTAQMAGENKQDTTANGKVSVNVLARLAKDTFGAN